MRRIPLAVLVLVLLFASGCARSGPQANPEVCSDPRGDTAFPVATTQDWVTYGDHLVTADVRPTAEDGWVKLTPALTLWSRAKAPPAPTAQRAWSNGDQASAEGVDLVKGHTYLVLLSWRHPSNEPSSWSSMDILAFDDGIVGTGPDQCWPAGSRPAREQLWGLNAAGVQRVLGSTRPDPLAGPYADLDPGERYQRIAADRE